LPFDLAGIWAGTGRYPVGKFLVIVISGKVIKVTTVAMAGYYGLQLLTGS
jgi:membrane protein DedA with SNARE-associated domain